MKTDEKKLEPVFKDYNPAYFKAKRRLLGYRNVDISNLCGLTRQTISNIETNRIPSKTTTLIIGICLDRLAERCEDEAIRKAYEALDNLS